MQDSGDWVDQEAFEFPEVLAWSDDEDEDEDWEEDLDWDDEEDEDDEDDEDWEDDDDDDEEDDIGVYGRKRVREDDWN